MAEVVPRFCVLGGGISGLSSALFLQRAFPLARISVIEQSQRCGGAILSERGKDGSLHERGFHSNVLNHRAGRETLGLVRLLNLDNEVTSANIETSARRHLYHQGRVQLIPRVPHMLRYGPAMLAEPLWARSSADDESVHDFISRRISKDVANQLADPICRGQFAGDPSNLSVRTCFPRLWFNEKRFRSIFVGSMLSTFSAFHRRSWLSLDLLDPLLQRVSTGGRCFSFKNGLGTLVDGLLSRLRNPPVGTRPADIILGKSVLKFVERSSDGVTDTEVVLSDGERIAADAIIATIPPSKLGELLDASGLACSDGTFSNMLSSIQFRSVGVVSVSFKTDVFKRRFSGAGYFCGSREHQQILGMCWDSQLFPDQLANARESRLTVYLDMHEMSSQDLSSIEDIAMAAVREHLGVDEEPVEVRSIHWHENVPQYAVGHHDLIRRFNTTRVLNLPWLQVAGAGYFGTRSPADEVVDARALSDSLCRRFARFPDLIENEVQEDSAHRYGGGFDA